MRRLAFAFVLAILSHPAASALHAAPARAAVPAHALLDRFDRHGFPSPTVAASQLAAAGRDAAFDHAPPELRARHHATLGWLASMADDAATAGAAGDALERLADGGNCTPCNARWRVRQALVAARADRFDEARAHLRDARAAEAAREPAIALSIHAADAYLHLRANQPDPALAAAIAGADLAERAGLPARQVELMSFAVNANIMRGDVDRALALSEEAYALAERIGYGFEMAVLRTNQAYIHGGREDNPRFHAALKEALRHSEGVPGLEDQVLTTLVNLSAYHIYVGEYAESVAVTQRAEVLARELGNELSRAFLISNRGSALARMGRVAEGLALMDEGTVLADRAGDKRASIDLLVEKVKVFELVGRHREALAALHRVVALNDALTRRERESAVQELQEKFAAERKSREIERLSAERARLEAIAQARTWQQRLWAAIAVAFALGSALLWLGVGYLRRRNRALEVRNARLSAESSRDALTGVANRRHGERLLARHRDSTSAVPADHHVGLLLLDVDHFKRINDEHGHAAGDAVLVEIAGRLQALVRDEDTVVRWGGEEFLLVLPGTDPDALRTIARRVLAAVGATPLEAAGRILRVTASAGAVAWPIQSGASWEAALHAADMALYRAKAEGRDRAACVAPAAIPADASGGAAEAARAAPVVMVTAERTAARAEACSENTV